MASARRNKQPLRRARQGPGFKFIISACLAGIDCTHSGSNKLIPGLRWRVKNGTAIAVCPEILGGSSVPREACEITDGDGADVLDKAARVITVADRDVTATLLRGARRTLELAARYGIRTAILKSKSPSCGCGIIYDGTFSRTLRKGDGVTAALLRRNGIEVISKG